MRLGGQVNYDARTVLFAGGSLEYRHYGGEDPSFLVTRRDTQYDLAVGAIYSSSRLRKITPRLTWTVNDSNIELNKYHREAVSLSVRRDF